MKEGKIRVREAIVVEGRYDKNTLSQIIDGAIVETSGFGVFKDDEKLRLLRRLCEHRGLVILTDSDGAGFVIRNYLKGALPKDRVKHAYIPDIRGRERRKKTASKEGTLGVEGMTREVLLAALKTAGATIEGADPSDAGRHAISKADLYFLGLSGTDGSAERRRALLRRLDLPEKLSSSAMLDVLRALYTLSELEEICSNL